MGSSSSSSFGGSLESYVSIRGETLGAGGEGWVSVHGTRSRLFLGPFFPIIHGNGAHVCTIVVVLVYKVQPGYIEKHTSWVWDQFFYFK
jgi:hypothetical protein